MIVLLLQVPLGQHSTVFGCYGNCEGQIPLFQCLKRNGKESDSVNWKAI